MGINPPVYDFAWFDLWAKPLGLLHALGYLRVRDNEVALIDCMHEGRTSPRSHGRWRVARSVCEHGERPEAYRGIPRRFYRFGLTEDAFERRLAAMSRPDVVLVTSIMTYWYVGVWETIRCVKKIFPGVPVILGGIYARLCEEHARGSGADFISLEETPRPACVPLDLYDAPTYAVLQTSYGCPMQCDYCASRLLTPSYIRRSVEETVRDLESQLAIAGVRDVAFYDDALLPDAARAFYPLCDEIQKIRKKIPDLKLHTPNGLHVANLDERACEALYQTGFETIRLSLEGIDPQSVAASSGKTSAFKYERAVRNLTRAGYSPERIETYILVGLPGQKVVEVRRAIEFVKSLGGHPKLAEFSPIPGTPLFATALVGTPEIAREPLLQNNSVYTQYIREEISPQELQSLKESAHK